MIVLDVHGAKLCKESGEVKSFGESQEFDDFGAALKAGTDAFNAAVKGGYRVEAACREVRGIAQETPTLFELKAYQKESA